MYDGGIFALWHGVYYDRASFFRDIPQAPPHAAQQPEQPEQPQEQPPLLRILTMRRSAKKTAAAITATIAISMILMSIPP